MPTIKYSIKKNRLRHSLMKGMELDEENERIYLTQEEVRRLYLPAIDQADEGGTWGRLSFDVELTEEMILYVYVAALDVDSVYDGEETYRIEDILMDEEVSDEQKKRLLLEAGGKRFVGKDDILLYELSGRYLFLGIEVIGAGEGTISHMRIDVRGDNFMETFPTVYHERNGFFHRFMSIFSSIYNDFDHEIERLPELLDPDTCPPVLLEIYGHWLGIDLSGDYLSEESMRTLVREGYTLNRMKGTKACLERVLEIALGERVIILEQNTIQSYMEKGDTVDEIDERQSIYDVNILIKKRLSETEQYQILHLIHQFTPLRSRIHLIHLKDSGMLDSNVYMDMNAVLAEDAYGYLDEEMEMDDGVILTD
ncbi:MAG: hypothetical protein IJV04_08900 [Lachnospiraceae bacterium]|nr:hypothetical protein [Lachnospiraceae bacterium]